LSFTHIKTKEGFIKRANERHSNKYDYSKVEFPKRELLRSYTGTCTRRPPEYYRETKIVIICPDHGEFVQTARKHIEKDPSGCQRCAHEVRFQAKIDKAGNASHFKANSHTIFNGIITIRTTPSDGIERETLLDECDIEILHYAKWYTTGHQKSRNSRTNYCNAGKSTRLIKEGYGWLGHKPKLHRLVMSRMLGRELISTEHIDHINGNGLDNRRENLRIATASQNHMNKTKQRGTYTSTYKGVSLRSDRLHLGWYANIKVEAKHIHLGRYPTEEAAAMAYDKKAKELFGEFAHLNFPG
jgi:hypothetical protein